MRFIFLSLLITNFAIAAPIHSNNYQLDLNIDAYSEPVSIRQFTHHWHDPHFQSGDNAFARGRLTINTPLTTQDHLGLLWRYDYLIHFDKDSAKLYYQYANQLNPEVSPYPINITAHYTEAYGINWQHTFNLQDNWLFKTNLSLLQGYKFTDGEVSGHLQFKNSGFQSKDVASTHINIDYYYDEPQLYEEQLDWHPHNPEGYGFSLDVESSFKPNENALLTLKAYDVLGFMYWHKAPHTQYQFDYQANPFDANLTGQLTNNQRFTQKLPIYGYVYFNYNYPNQHWHISTNSLIDAHNNLTTLAMGYHFKPVTADLLVEPQTHALGLDLSHQYLHLRWLTDSLNTNKAHRLNANIAILFVW